MSTGQSDTQSNAQGNKYETSDYSSDYSDDSEIRFIEIPKNDFEEEERASCEEDKKEEGTSCEKDKEKEKGTLLLFAFAEDSYSEDESSDHHKEHHPPSRANTRSIIRENKRATRAFLYEECIPIAAFFDAMKQDVEKLFEESIDKHASEMVKDYRSHGLDNPKRELLNQAVSIFFCHLFQQKASYFHFMSDELVGDAVDDAVDEEEEEIIQEHYDTFWSLLLSEARDALDEEPDERFESALRESLSY